MMFITPRHPGNWKVATQRYPFTVTWRIWTLLIGPISSYNNRFSRDAPTSSYNVNSEKGTMDLIGICLLLRPCCKRCYQSRKCILRPRVCIIETTEEIKIFFFPGWRLAWERLWVSRSINLKSYNNKFFILPI